MSFFRFCPLLGFGFQPKPTDCYNRVDSFSKILFSCLLSSHFKFLFVNYLISCMFYSREEAILLPYLRVYMEEEEEEEKVEEGPVSTTDSARRGGRGHFGSSSPSLAFVPRPGRPHQNKDLRQSSFSALVFLGSKVVEWTYLN